jgi:hypothetical protein
VVLYSRFEKDPLRLLRMYFARTHQKGVGCRLWRRPRLKVWKFFLMQKKFALEVGLGREELMINRVTISATFGA